jgi:hypothetical protein
MNDGIAAFGNAIQKLASISGWQIVGAITAAGTIAMALLQLVKELTPIRRSYQRYWMRSWIKAHAKDLSPSKAEVLLVELSTGGAENAFYELPIEQLVGQMNAAVQITLDYPKKYHDLLFILAEGADPKDINSIISKSPEGSRTKTGPSNEYLEARTRVSHRIQRNLDAIQIALGSRWKFWMQIIAITLSTLLIEGAVIAANSGSVQISTMLLALPVAILGGYFAPVTRDLVAALQTLRK